MSKNSFRRVRLALEALEQRDVPSVAAGAAVSLGSANSYAALGLVSSHIVSLDASVTGDAGVSKGGDFFNLGSTITGGVVEAGRGQYLGFGKANPTVTIDAALLSKADSDALSASTQAAGLQATQTFKNINAATTVTGDGGVNVIDISGDIKNSLILNGTSSDVFIVNVKGSVDLSGRETLGLAGGVTAGHVLYNFIGSKGSVDAGNGTVIDGTLLGPNYGFDIDGTVNGEIIAGGELLLMRAKVTEVSFSAPVAASAGSLSGIAFISSTSPISGLTIELEDSSGNVLQTAVTDATGAYSFTNLPSGTYQLVAVPGIYQAIAADVGSVNGTADGSSVGKVTIGSIDLPSGGVGINYDFKLGTGG
jgi:hypothetical protein